MFHAFLNKLGQGSYRKHRNVNLLLGSSFSISGLYASALLCILLLKYLPASFHPANHLAFDHLALMLALTIVFMSGLVLIGVFPFLFGVFIVWNEMKRPNDNDVLQASPLTWDIVTATIILGLLAILSQLPAGNPAGLPVVIVIAAIAVRTASRSAR